MYGWLMVVLVLVLVLAGGGGAYCKRCMGELGCKFRRCAVFGVEVSVEVQVSFMSELGISR